MPLQTVKLSLDDLTRRTIGAAIEIHRNVGPGLFESVYEKLLAASLRKQGLHVRRQVTVTFIYDGIRFKRAFRLDLLIERTLVVEVKSIETVKAVYKKQLLTYLRLSQRPLGLLLNFGVETLRDGLHRVANNLDPSDSPLLRVNLPD